jgi:hypothetical protein
LGHWHRKSFIDSAMRLAVHCRIKNGFGDLMSLWTCHLAMGSSRIFTQVRASNVNEAVVAFLSEKPFQLLLGPACGWPEDPNDHEQVELFPNEEFPGFYGCSLVNGRGENANISLIETVDQEWPPEGFDA